MLELDLHRTGLMRTRSYLLALCSLLGCSTREPAPDAGGVRTLAASKAAEVRAERKALVRSAAPAPSDVASPPEAAERSPSGLVSRVIKAGSGTARPTIDDTVTIVYDAWTADGRAFDGTSIRGAPLNIHLRSAVAGWREGIPTMT